MLFLVAAWAVLLAVSVPTGTAVLRWTGSRAFDRPGDRFVLSAWLGLLVLGSGLLAISLLFPLSPFVGGVAGFGAAAAALSWRRVRDEISSLRAHLSRRLIGACLALAVGVALFTAQPVVWFDTGLYHAGAIRWLAEFGAVEGIGLIHYPLGFGSSWFALAAPFSPDGLREHTTVVLGGFALLLLILHALICISRALRRDARPADWLLIAGSALLVPALAALLKAHVSTSPDLPVAILGLLVGWAIFTAVDPQHARGAAASRLSPGPAAVPLLLALGAMTIKLQAAPLAAVAALFYVLAGEDRFRRAMWVGVLGIALVGPWLAYEFVVTGCPVYPVPACTNVPWSVGSDAARQTAETVETVTRWGDESAPGSSLEWVGPWLTNDLSPALGALALASLFAIGGGLLVGSRFPPTSELRIAMTWVAILGAAGLLLFLLRTEQITMMLIACLSLIPLSGRRPGTGWLLALGLAGIALTLYAGPDPRYALGFTAVLFARLTVFHGPRFWTRLRPYLAPPRRLPELSLATLLFAGAVCGALGPLLRPTTPLSEGPSLLSPPEIPAAVAVQPTNGIPYQVPPGVARPTEAAVPGSPNGLCWAAELPCTAGYEIDPRVVLRDQDTGISGGFERSSDE
ncbi:MAG: LIC_10190 family membrane protein [Solirubrobacterales bacterium]